MAKKKAKEVVYIIHAIRKGKPTPIDKEVFEKSKMYFYSDGYQLATDAQIAKHYDIKKAAPKKEEPKEIESKEQK